MFSVYPMGRRQKLFSVFFSAVCRGGWFETVAYLDHTFCIDMYMNVTPCCASAAGSNYQFDTGEVLRPREREGPSAGASPNSPTHLLL